MSDELDYDDPVAVRAAAFCPCCGARQQGASDHICIDCHAAKHAVRDCGCSTCRYCVVHLPDDRLAQLIDIAYADAQLQQEMLICAGMGPYCR